MCKNISALLYLYLRILCLDCCLVYPICLGYTTFLASGIYAQSAQIEFSALNSINALYGICTSCHNTCNICRKIVMIIYYFIYIFIILIP